MENIYHTIRNRTKSPRTLESNSKGPLSAAKPLLMDIFCTNKSTPVSFSWLKVIAGYDYSSLFCDSELKRSQKRDAVDPKRVPPWRIPRFRVDTLLGKLMDIRNLCSHAVELNMPANLFPKRNLLQWAVFGFDGFSFHNPQETIYLVRPVLASLSRSTSNCLEQRRTAKGCVCPQHVCATA